MRRAALLGLSLLMVLSLVISACGTTGTTGSGLKVALVTDVGKVNDGTFNELAYKGFVRAAEEFKLKSAYIETLAITDYEKNITQFAEEKYDVIITVGFMIGDATAAMSKKYPGHQVRHR